METNFDQFFHHKMRKFTSILFFLVLVSPSLAQTTDTTRVQQNTPATPTNQASIKASRVRLTDPDFSGIKFESGTIISMKIMVDENGKVVSIKSTSQTTMKDPLELEKILEAWKLVLYEPKPGTPDEVVYLFIRIK